MIPPKPGDFLFEARKPRSLLLVLEVEETPLGLMMDVLDERGKSRYLNWSPSKFTRCSIEEWEVEKTA